MLKLPRRRNPYYRKPYYAKRKTLPSISLRWLIVAIPVSIILLELVLRALVGLTGKEEQFTGQSAIANAYQLKFLTETQKPIDGVPSNGKLIAKRTPSLSYQLVGNQKNQFWQTNAQGFREKDPLPLAKPKDEIRIFILGNSTAFGQGNQKNEDTIGYQLQTRLQERVARQKRSPEQYRPDVFPFFQPSREKLFKLPPKIKQGNYRVINAAVPGYTSGNQLAQLALQILPYQPDAIVILDGYGDLMLPSDRTQADIPKVDDFLEDAPQHFQTTVGQSVNRWLKASYLSKSLNSWVFKSETKATSADLSLNLEGQSLPKDEEELKQRISRYQNHQKQIVQLSAAAGIPVVIATQPEITGRPVEKLSPQEKAIRDRLGRDYLETMPQAYARLLQANQALIKIFPKNVKVLNFYNLDSKFPSPAFLDEIHLNEKANGAVAEALYNAIASWEKIQIVPENFYLKKQTQS